MIEVDCIITSGYVDILTLQNREKNGWQFVVTVPGKIVHPSAFDTDKATFWTRYTPPAVNNSEEIKGE